MADSRAYDHDLSLGRDAGRERSTRDALDARFAEIIRPITAVLLSLFSLFAVVDYLTVPEGSIALILSIDLVVGLIILGLRMGLRGGLPLWAIHPSAALVVLSVCCSVLATSYVRDAPMYAVLVPIALITTSGVFLSVRWFSVVLGVASAGWLAFMSPGLAGIPGSGSIDALTADVWSAFTIAAVLSYVIQILRVQHYIRFEALQVENRDALAVARRELEERRKVEETLRADQRHMSALTEHQSDFILELDAGWRIVHANPSFQAFTGFDPARDSGQRASDYLLHGEPAWQEGAAPMLVGRGTFLLRGLNGDSMWVETTGSSYITADGSTHIVAIARDISDQLEAEQQQRALTERIQQAEKLESLGLLAGGIAHDFNNLLVGISGNAELASASLEPDSPAAELIAEIETAGQSAADLVRQLLAYAGRGTLTVRALDFSQLVRDATSVLHLPNSETLEIGFDLSPEPLWVEADEVQTRQVVMNLVFNAAEALGDEPGLLHVSSGRLQVDATSLRGKFVMGEIESGPHAFLEVTDTGCGITGDSLERIFEPFYTTKFMGRGLGLAAVLGVMRSHGGALEVDTTPGVGTRFRVLLPICDTPGEPTRSSAELLVPSARGAVLIVDDQAAVRRVARRQLEMRGYRTLEASRGDDALRIFREAGTDIGLALVDLTMPEMGGEELFHELRLMRPDLPVVFMSGHSEEDVTARVADFKGVDAVQKPFSSKVLASKVGALLAPEFPSHDGTSRRR